MFVSKKRSAVHTLRKAFNLVVFVVTFPHVPSVADKVKKLQEQLPGLLSQQEMSGDMETCIDTFH